MSKLNGTQRIFVAGMLYQFRDTIKKLIEDNKEEDTKKALEYLLNKLGEMYADLLLETLEEVQKNIRKSLIDEN